MTAANEITLIKNRQACIKILNEDVFLFPGKNILAATRYINLEVIDHSKHATVDMVDNHRVTGGCNMNLHNLPLVEKVLSASDIKNIDIAKQDCGYETMKQVTIEGKPYALFQLKTQNKLKMSPSLQEIGDFLPIHIAAASGDVNAIVRFTKTNPRLIHAQNHNGATPLHLAAENGQTEAVNLLIHLGANVDHLLPNNLFPLYVAILNGHTEAALTLIKKANINLSMEGGNTPLHLAADTKQLTVAFALISNGAHINVKRKMDGYSPLHCAAEQGLSQLCQKLLRTGKILVNSSLGCQKTAVYLAAKNGHLQTVSLLEKNFRANINKPSGVGETPLMVALAQGHREVARYLAAHVNINSVNAAKQTASLYAASLGQFDIADLLIARGENPLHEDQYGNTVVYYLLRAGQFYRYKNLVENNGINAHIGFHALTSLDIAKKYQHDLLVDYLESKNVKTSLQEVEPVVLSQQELMLFAVKTGSKKKISFALDQCIDVNMSLDDQGNTMAHIAADRGLATVLSHLNACGINFNQENKQGITSFHSAILCDNDYLLKKLLKLVPTASWPKDILAFAEKNNKLSCVKRLKRMIW